MSKDWVARAEHVRDTDEDGDAAKNGYIETFPVEASDRTIHLKRYIILIYQGTEGEYGTINYKLFQKLRDILDSEVTTPKEETEIDIWLDSGGGEASAAYKIALLLRARAAKLRIVVPDYAKSAATLLSLAADQIYMGEAAELGPLDAQIRYEKAGMPISALDVARSLEDLAEKGISMALSGGAAVLETTQLSRTDSLNAMVEFATKFMSPVIDKLDPTIIHWSSSLLNESADYARRLIRMRHTGRLPISERLRKLPDDLVGLYPAHGFVISRDEARNLGLPIENLEDYDYCDEVERLARRLDDDGVNCVQAVKLPDGGEQPSNDGAGGVTAVGSTNEQPSGSPTNPVH